jgi:hypothetical protein
MSVRRFPKHKDESYKERYLYTKTVESYLDDFCCPEIENVCKIMGLAEELHLAGWKVKVDPFEDYPLLHVRAKKKRRLHL